MTKKSITGYCDPLTVSPGQTVRFMVSCHEAGDFQADLVRVICGDTSRRGAGFKEEEIPSPVSGAYPGRNQPIHPGSYGIVPASPLISDLRSFTVQAMIWPTTPTKGRQWIMGAWSEDDQAGFALIIDTDGSAALLLGDGRGNSEIVRAEVPLLERRWCLVAGAYDAETGRATVLQIPQPFSPGADAVAPRAIAETRVAPNLAVPGSAPFLFAARLEGLEGGKTIVGGFYNGKVDAPRLSNRYLTEKEIDALCAPRISPSLAGAVVGFWDISRDISSERITDLSSNRLHGETVNLPTRAVTGYNWTGEETRWTHAPDQYGAIHYHDDDIYDAGWETDFEFTVPGTMRSGVYAARLRLGESDDYIPFFVRPPRGKPTADVAFLASTANYMAYANVRLAIDDPNFLGANRASFHPNEQYLIDHPEVGGSLYEHHSDGSGVHYTSRLRPILNMKPKAVMWSMNADTNITDWLEQSGNRFDVVTDEDLHAERADLLRPYRVIVTGTHPEYYSTEMLDALETYLREGGRLMYMGGNGFYWRVAFHAELPGVIEVRRAEDGTRAWISEPGEYYQSFNGEYGGLWRRLGRPPNLLAGVGFAAQGFDKSSYYRLKPGAKDPRAAFIFEGVESDEIIGDYGRLGGGAAGEEIDRFDATLGSPPHALVLASSEKHTPLMLRVKEEFHSTTPWFDDPKVRADLVFFEGPNGGAVFSTGSIAWSASLAHNGYENDIYRITTNALRRFVRPEPFVLPQLDRETIRAVQESEPGTMGHD